MKNVTKATTATMPADPVHAPVQVRFQHRVSRPQRALSPGSPSWDRSSRSTRPSATGRHTSTRATDMVTVPTNASRPEGVSRPSWVSNTPNTPAAVKATSTRNPTWSPNPRRKLCSTRSTAAGSRRRQARNAVTKRTVSSP